MSRAGKIIDSWQTCASTGGAPVRTVAQAVASYLGDCKARNLAESTLKSYAKTLEHVQEFCERVGVRHIQEIDLGALTDFRANRDIAASTSGRELETLRAFCAFATKRKWLPENYAQDLTPPKEDGCPTLPYNREEVDAILEACDKLEDDNTPMRERTRARARALCLLLLYSGLRISDAIKLERAAIDLHTGKMLLRIMKTGAKQYIRINEHAVEALRALPQDSDYFLWTGRGRLATAIGNARRTISRVLAIAGIEGHPHRFRDTFSVFLLQNGEDLRTVQLLLGHKSIRTTEKHYAPYVDSFQRILDAATAKLDFGRVHIRTTSSISDRSNLSSNFQRPNEISKLLNRKAV